MELPHLGEHCAQPDCNQLDYLPITCSLCNKIYCTAHHKYEDHNCPESYKLDVRVPICPLCGKPVPSKRGVTPDLAVNEHLESNCQSKSKKIYSNRCSVSGCKIKELVSIECDSCNFNYCLRHRHTSDHYCKGPLAKKREQTLGGSIFKNWFKGNNSTGSNVSSHSHGKANGVQNKAKFNREPNIQKSKTPNTVLQVSPTVREANVSIFQGNLSEDEAIRRALLTSQGMEEDPPQENETSEDENLARAIALSLQVQNESEQKDKTSNDCSIS